MFALLGVLVSYVGLRRSQPITAAVGLWLALAMPNVTSFVCLAVLLYAGRQRVLLKLLATFLALIVLTSLLQPSWLLDLLALYRERLLHPQPTYFPTMVLPGFPWTQLLLIVCGLIILVFIVRKSQDNRPSLGAWSVLTCCSLVSALHIFTYDWLLLMLPLAWQLQQRAGFYVVAALNAYPLVWALLPPIQSIMVLSPVFIPSALLMIVLMRHIVPHSLLGLSRA